MAVYGAGAPHGLSRSIVPLAFLAPDLPPRVYDGTTDHEVIPQQPVPPVVGGNTLTLQIGAVADNSVMGSLTDSESNSRTTITTSGPINNGLVDAGSGPTSLMPGEHGATNNCNSVALLFRNVTIPQGTILTSAILTLYGGSFYNATTTTPGHFITMWVSAQASDNAASLTTTAGDLRSSVRPRSTAFTTWDISSNIGQGSPNTLDITAVVQEIISRAGFVSGNTVCILLDVKGAPNTGVGNTAPSEWNDFQAYTAGQAALAPTLTIVTPAGGGTTPINDSDSSTESEAITGISLDGVTESGTSTESVTLTTDTEDNENISLGEVAAAVTLDNIAPEAVAATEAVSSLSLAGVTDSGAETESLTLTTATAASESAVETEAIVRVTLSGPTDSAAVGESAAVSNLISSSDAATATDAASSIALAGSSDTGTITEGASITALPVSSDAATASETTANVTLTGISESAVASEGSKSIALAGVTESAALAEASILAATFIVTDAAAATESVSSVALSGVTDNATASEGTISVALRGLTESAAVVEASILTASFTTTDTATATESVSPVMLTGVTDTATTSDTAALTTALAATDAAAMGETASGTALVSAADSGALTENAVILTGGTTVTDADAADLTDAPSNVLLVVSEGQQYLLFTARDQATLTESATVAQLILVTASDNATLAESTTITPLVPTLITDSDSAAMTENASLTINVSDTAHLTDSVTTMIALLSANDTATLVYTGMPPIFHLSQRPAILAKATSVLTLSVDATSGLTIRPEAEAMLVILAEEPVVSEA